VGGRAWPPVDGRNGEGELSISGRDPGSTQALGILERGLAERAFPGAAYAFGRVDGPIFAGAAGRLADDRDLAVGTSTRFDMASVTKPTVTALTALRLCDAGVLDLDRPVADLVPGAADRSPAWRGINVWHLLTHSSGLHSWLPLFREADCRAALIGRLLAEGLEAPPLTRYCYSCLGYILAGWIIELVTGEGLDQVARREIWDRLGMATAGYNPAPGETPRIPPTEVCAWEGARVCGRVHDENARRMAGVSGNAGLFASIDDWLPFVRGLVLNRALDGAPFLSEKSRLLHFTRQLPDLPDGFATCGWMVSGHGYLPLDERWPATTLGHGGFTGTMLVWDPATGEFAVLLANRVYYGRDNYERFAPIRRAWLAAVRDRMATL